MATQEMIDRINNIDSSGSGAGPNGRWWTYSNTEHKNYLPQLTGDVVMVSFTAATDFNTKQPMYFDNGDPKVLWVLAVIDGNGERWLWCTAPGKTHYKQDILPLLTTGSKFIDFANFFLGKNVTISTPGYAQNPQPGKPPYRKFDIRVNGQATHPVEGVDYDSYPPKRQAAPQPQQQAPAQPQPQYQQPQYQQPQPQPQYQLPNDLGQRGYVAVPSPGGQVAPPAQQPPDDVYAYDVQL